MIFDFEEIIYLDYNLNLFINNRKINGNSLDILQDCINKWKIKTKDNEIAALGFFSYDFKDLLYPNYQFRQNTNMNIPYFWFGKPKKTIDIDNYTYRFKPQSLELVKDLDELKGATNTQTTDEPPQEEESDVSLDEMKEVENETNDANPEETEPSNT